MPLYTLADRSASAKAGGTTAAAQSVKRCHPTSGYAVRSPSISIEYPAKMDDPIQEIDRQVQVAVSSKDASCLTEILEGLRDRLDVSGLAE
ncbi:MAG: hypothetical protein MK335_00655 [Gemmatimonadetes bacterium]|nr:hypothetical protein [Gemmatimonadota bacterium]